jgi:uncharacterized delta-60 repeat protein
MRANKKPQTRLGCERLDDRLNPANLDPTFGDGGFVTLPTTELGLTPYPNFRQPTADGGLLMITEGKEGLELVKLTSAGKLDTVFGGGDGRVLAGEKFDYTFPQYNPVSTLTLPFRISPQVIGAAFDAQGRVLVATSIETQKYGDPGNTSSPDGTFVWTVPPYTTDITTTVTRYRADGSIDTSYGQDGKLTIRNAEVPVRFGSRMAVTADGAIYLGGTTQRADTLQGGDTVPSTDLTQSSEQLVRITPTGVVDTAFGTNGIRSIDLGVSNVAGGGSIQSITALADGDLLLVGNFNEATPIPPEPSLLPTTTSSLLTVRLNADGSFDTAYGTNGLQRTKAGDNIYSTAYDARVLPDGRVVGIAQNYPYLRITPVSNETGAPELRTPTVDAVYAFRLTATGQLDTTFSGDGKFGITSNYFLDDYRTGYSPINLQLAPDGGSYLIGNTVDWLTIQKLTAAGDVDTNFGKGGFAVLPLPYRTPEVIGFNPAASSSTADTPSKLSTGLNGWLGTAVVTTTGDLLFVGQRQNDVPPTVGLGYDLALARVDIDAPTPDLPPEPIRFNPVTRDIGPFFNTQMADVNGDGVLDAIIFNLAPFPTVGSGNAVTTPNIETVPGSRAVNVPGELIAFPPAPTPTTSRMWVQDGKSGGLLVEVFAPFEESFTGGLVVATGDMNNDGKAEIVVGPDVGGGARIQTYQYDGDTTLALTDNFFAIDDVNFRGGVRVAVGDIDGDDRMDLIVGAGPGGGPRAVVFDGDDLMQRSSRPRKLISDFFAFPGEDAARLRDGVAVGAQDTNGDGMAELFFGAGPGGAPRVFVVDGALMAAGKMDRAFAVPVANGYVGGDSESRAGVQFFAEMTAAGQQQLRVVNTAGSDIRIVPAFTVTSADPFSGVFVD